MKSDLGPLPINHRDFLLKREVRDMPPLAFKAYVLLLCELWENGPLPNDIEVLALCGGVSKTIMNNKVWESIADLFVPIDGDLLDHEFTFEQRKKAVKGLVARQKMSAAATKRNMGPYSS